MINSFFIRNFPKLSIYYRNISKYGYEPEMDYLKILSQGFVAIDIGGHLGNYSYILNKLCITTHVFEPNLFLYDILTKSGLNNTKVYNIACSDSKGFTTLKIPEVGGIFRLGNATIEKSDTIQNITSYYIQAVQTNTIDSYNLTNIGLIKIDVEGHELNVIKGSLETISCFKPNLIIEISSNNFKNKILELIEILPKDYRVFNYCNKMKKIVEMIDFDHPSFSSNYIFLNAKTVSNLIS